MSRAVIAIENTFVERMSQERGSQRLSQKALAAILQSAGLAVHQTTIARIEAGERSVRLGEAVLIAQALGFTLPEMLGVSEAPPSDRVRDLRGSLAFLGRILADHEALLGQHQALRDELRQDLADEVAKAGDPR